MLLNLSNHPSARWGQEQLQVAKEQFGAVQDMPFPNIDPSWTTTKVAQLAKSYFKQILEHKTKAVHLMGEMTFTYILVSLLQTSGIQCVASTSERKVIEEEDGKKTVLFNFKQFREYPQV